MTKEEIDKYYNYARTNDKWMHLMVVKKVIEDCFNKPNMHWNNDKDLKVNGKYLYSRIIIKKNQ